MGNRKSLVGDDDLFKYISRKEYSPMPLICGLVQR